MLSGCVPWPDDLVERYRKEGYWRGQLLGDILEPWQSLPERIAVVDNARIWTYADLHAAANRLAGGLQSLGVREDDRVVVQLPNISEFIVLMLALFRIGALPILTLPAHRLNEIAYIAKHAEASVYVIPCMHGGFDYRELARQVVASAPSVRHVLVLGEPGEFTSFWDVDGPRQDVQVPKPSDVALFLLSGGTTGLPKLIPRTHDDYAFQLGATADAIGVDVESVYLAALPVAHNATLGCPGVLGTLRAGGRVVLALTPAPDEAFDLIEREHVTHTTLMPSVLKLWLDVAEIWKINLADVLFQVGGALLDPEDARRIRRELGARLTHWFGMAEGFLSHTRLNDPEDVIATTQGRPLCAGDERRVVDSFERDVPAGAIGQLLVRGPYTLRGYYRADEYNAGAFTHDGYLRTGDLVTVNASDNMIVKGRIKDVVNRGGEKVPAAEIEHHLLRHPHIRAAAVIPIPDEALGEKTCAVIVSDNGNLDLQTVKEHLTCLGLAAYKLPDRVELVASLPYTEVGKVDKRRLRDWVLGEAMLPPEPRGASSS